MLLVKGIMRFRKMALLQPVLQPVLKGKIRLYRLVLVLISDFDADLFLWVFLTAQRQECQYMATGDISTTMLIAAHQWTSQLLYYIN